MSDGHIGQVAWNKNKRDIYSEKSLLKMKESHTGVKLPRERVEKSRAGIIRAWTPAKKEKARVTALNRHYVPTKETLEKMRSAAIKREALKKKNGFVGYWKGKKMPPHKENCKCAGCMSKRGTPYRRKTYRS
jgi:hypothetical protein